MPLLLKLENLLWNEKEQQDSYSIWLLSGTLLFAGFVTLLMFDLLLMLAAMVGMIGVLELSKGRRKGVLWLGVGIGLGVLAKGPVILLHVLPAAVVAPWWAPHLKGKFARWYFDLLLGVLLGAAIALAWALPAAYFGGEAYRHAIFWGQTAGRVSESFAHRAPWWYYAPLLPMLLFPWFVWPRVWVGMKGIFQDSSSKFLLAWLLLTLIAFSLVSGKQAKYLVPFLPAFALLAGHALSKAPSIVQGKTALARCWEMLPPLAGFLAFPAVLAWLRTRPDAMKLPEWVGDIPLWTILLPVLAAPLLMIFARWKIQAQVRALAFAMLAAAAVLGTGVIPAFAPYSDPVPAARHLAALQERKVPLAHLGKYHAQYNFAGRLRAPIAILGHDELATWVRGNPGGQVLTVERARAADGGLEKQWEYRGAWLQLWRGEALLAARPAPR